MKNKRIKNFNDFVNESYNPELNEGFFSNISNLIKKVGGWAGEFIKAIGQGLIRPIPSGPMKGMPVAMLFLPENGSIYQQMLKYRQGINPLLEAKIPLEYTGEDQSVRNISSKELKNDVIRLYKSKKNKKKFGLYHLGKIDWVIHDGIKFEPPVEFKAYVKIVGPDNKTLGKTQLDQMEPGNMTFSVYMKELDELNITIDFGDYIAYYETETRVRYYSVVNDGRVTSDLKHSYGGYKAFYKTYIAAPVNNNEFRGL
jgi:hypothetical protein